MLALLESVRLGLHTEGILIDSGAYDNLGGSAFDDRMVKLLSQHGRKPIERKSGQTITVTGVGNGANSTQRIVKYPGMVVDRDGRAHNMTFETPILPDSNVAALWGHRSLRQHRAVLDMVNQELIICGPGDVRLTPPPGSLTLPLTLSPSGHLILPITEFNNGKKAPANSQQSRSFPYVPSGPGSSSSSSGSSSVPLALARAPKPIQEQRHVVIDPVPEVRVIGVNNTGVQTEIEQTKRFSLIDQDAATDDEVDVIEVFDMGDRGRPVAVPNSCDSS